MKASIKSRIFLNILSEEMNVWMEKIPTPNEIKETLINNPSNKAPGLDGYV